MLDDNDGHLPDLKSLQMSSSSRFFLLAYLSRTHNQITHVIVYSVEDKAN